MLSRTYISNDSGTGNNVSRSTQLGDLNGDGVLDIVVAGRTVEGARVVGRTSVFFGETKDGVSPLLPFDLTTMADARQALPVFQQKLDQLAAQRGEIGAFQSRLGVAVSVLSSSTESMAAASGRIQDADVAEESAAMIRAKILQDAGAAVLAQANQQSALVLQLLNSTS
jgi:flagellin